VSAVVSKIDFFSLSRPVQDRFAAATRRSAPPAPILFERAPRGAAWAYLGASGALVLVFAILLAGGWGDVHSSLALHGTKWLIVDCALLSAAAYGVLHAVGLLTALESLPYRPGTYLFPGCAVDARGPVLQVWDMSDAEVVERVDSPSPGLALKMRDGSRVVIPARSAKEAERAEAALTQLRKRLAEAIERGDMHTLAGLDPLHDSAMSCPIGPTEKMKPRVSIWARVDWAIALVLGFALGHTLVTSRNSISDDAMYQTVLADGTAGAYRQYLAQGGRHSQDVEQTLLPRAELHDAEAARDIKAVEGFGAAHPSAKISTEVDAALRRLLLEELDKVKALHTVTALDGFAHQFPVGPVNAEWTAARHAIYVAALAAWKKKPHTDATVALMDRLLAWSEKKGPILDVRFQQLPSTSIDDADASARKSGHFPGNDALPSNFVTVDALLPRQKLVAQALSASFTEAFASDVLFVRPVEPLAPDAAAPPEPPALVVSYAPEWSHATTPCVKPDTVFVGLIFAFDGTVTVPDGKPPLKLTVKSWRGSESWKVKPEGRTREEFEQKVYDGMIDGAFEQLAKKLIDQLL
jgi:hypothetical protein